MATSNCLFMVRPFYFGSNPQTLESNIWQAKIDFPLHKIQQKALKEFSDVIEQLTKLDVNVIVLNNSNEQTPDAVFPNNWVTFHENGEVILYPMMAQSRRLERQLNILQRLQDTHLISSIHDWSNYENENKFLEGTGSMVLDRYYKRVYACLSPRTNLELLQKFARDMDYQLFTFEAKIKNVECYHTNIIMALAEKFAIFCSDALVHRSELHKIQRSLMETGREVINITIEQVNHFAGNALEIASKQGKRILAISQSGYHSFKPEQINAIEKYCHVEAFQIQTIEKYGGGSIRCMMAEIFLPKQKEVKS